MLAPIALYPDALLGQVLMAATYPLEIVEADRWLQDPDNAALRGAGLVQALQQQPWDPSVKSLVAYPQVLEVLDSNLDWTEQIGEAFIAQQRDVMDRVQQLRKRAENARTLISTPQQVVSDDGPFVEIAPPDVSNLYVPVYDPGLVYGSWPYGDAPPYQFDMGGYFPGTFVAFVILAPLWGWNQWDWRDHTLYVNGATGTQAGSRQPVRHVPWRHDPAHRDGVRYANAALQARYGRGQTGAAPAGRPAAVRVPAPAEASLAPQRPAAPDKAAARGEGAAAANRGAAVVNLAASPSPAHGASSPPPPPAHPALPPADHGATETHVHAPEPRGAEPREAGAPGSTRDRR